MATPASPTLVNDPSALAAEHFWPHSKRPGDMSKDSGVQLVTGGSGVFVTDADGEQWFDTLSGLWLVNIGHGRMEIAEAVYAQMRALSFSPHDTVSPITAQLAARLAALSSDTRSRTYFVSGGSEAVETALKLAKQYHRENGEPTRWKVISRRGSYHGSTLACTSLGRGGGGTARAVPDQFGPLVPGQHPRGARPTEYRCHFCAESGAVARPSVCEGRRARHRARGRRHTVAAFVGEPISAAAGIHVHLTRTTGRRVREICDRHRRADDL